MAFYFVLRTTIFIFQFSNIYDNDAQRDVAISFVLGQKSSDALVRDHTGCLWNKVIIAKISKGGNGFDYLSTLVYIALALGGL